ncbi:MAG TPA: hypothetical protein VFX59_30725 [Polyangiales bacterium]|nr:hypothetical protein [Polyangiales bacterium]
MRLVLIVALLGLLATPARAELSGAVDGRALIGLDGRAGGAVMLDVWALRGTWRPGGCFGMGGLSSHDSASSRLISPFGLSLAFVPWPAGSSLFVVARGGGYVGVEKGGFLAGGFAGGALGYALDLGEGSSVRFAVNTWVLIGARGGLFLGPSVGLGF